MTRKPDRVQLSDASIRLDAMPPSGRELRLTVSDEERAAVAFLGVTAVDRLEVFLNAVKFRGGMRVTGRLNASIVQPSVVSLEPVRQEIAEPIDRVFLPSGEKPFASSAGAEIFVDLEGEDVPDHFEGPEADLSDLVVETLSLAVDPYPRGADETIADLGVELHEEEPSPFARLKSLTDPDDKP